MPALSADTVLVPVGLLHYHVVGDGTWIVLSPDPPQWVHVDYCGKEVVAACDGERTFSEVVEEVCCRLGAGASDSYDHLCSFVQELSETGMLCDGGEADRECVGDPPALPQDKLGFQISWDGATPSTVDLIRGGGVFRRIQGNYRALRSAGFRGPVVFSMTVMKPNLHEITAFAEMAAREKVSGVHYPFLTLAGRAIPNRVHLETPRSAWKTVFTQIAAVAERCTDVQISFSRDPMFLCELSKRKMQHCGAGISTWSVEPDGGVTPCASCTNSRTIVKVVNCASYVAADAW